jgi:GNAT superfamily N-acetyltransferase
MYDLEVLDSSRILEFENLFYDSEVRSSLEQVDYYKSVMGVLARFKGQPVGLALGKVFLKGDTGQVLSLYVDSTFRNKRMGTALMQKVEAELKKKHCDNLTLGFKADELELLSLKKLLDKCGWEPPKIQGYNYQTTVEHFFKDLPWARRSREFPYRSYIFPWKDLTKEEKQKLEEEEGPDSWKETGTSPFFFGGTFEPQTSLGLRVGGDVVGWIINHQIKPDEILYGSYFVRPRFRGRGLSISLLLESLKLQKEAGIPNCNWFVEAPNKLVKKFYQKVLGPCVIKEEEFWLASKSLKEKPPQ